MRFRYRDAKGKVVTLNDVASLMQAIKDGSLGPETPLSVGEGTFQPAERVSSYQQALKGIDRLGLGAKPSPTPTLSEASKTRLGDSSVWYRRRQFQMYAAIGGACLLVLLAGVRLAVLNRIRTAQAQVVHADQVSGPLGEAMLKRIRTEYADSVVVLQARLLSSIVKQGFKERFQGSALQTPSSLRWVRTAAAKYRGDVDSMLGATRAISGTLITRAESLEAKTPAYDGLGSSVEEGLAPWERDLDDYTAIHRMVASTIDSMAAFVLEHQPSIVIRDGRAVFLSRAEGARFQEFMGRFTDFAARERSWADGVAKKRPEWRPAVSSGTNPPRFGMNVMARQ